MLHEVKNIIQAKVLGSRIESYWRQGNRRLPQKPKVHVSKSLFGVLCDDKKRSFEYTHDVRAMATRVKDKKAHRVLAFSVLCYAKISWIKSGKNSILHASNDPNG